MAVGLEEEYPIHADGGAREDKDEKVRLYRGEVDAPSRCRHPDKYKCDADKASHHRHEARGHSNVAHEDAHRAEYGH